METGSILDRKRSVRPSIDEETVDAVRVAFHHSPRKSIRVASNKLAVSRSIVHKVLHKQQLVISIYCTKEHIALFVEWSTCFILCCKLKLLLKMIYSCLF